ncbi:CHAT domain-containing protein [Propionivibrio dicarboxylicus]|uniref:CHAT domain-containing protein n=1 Tax=Propionivibrio dicarboxylicus TaxID=83767 RepID=A0A1G8GBW9_9RHOO|nr:CHAT domain-containing protein [Propionivibrio dicarboxylicus]SDH91922.1 CHAT domain-containing protein [Propionivibrio dicarboxylicus]
MAARYGDLEKHASQDVQDLSNARTYKLAPLCIAYAKQKKYDKAFPCFDQLEKNLKRGDTNYTDIEQQEKDSPLIMSLARMGSRMSNTSLEMDFTPYFYVMRAETYMDIGEFDKAIADARSAIAAKPREPRRLRSHEITTLGVLALAEALSGKRDAALADARKLEAIGTESPYHLFAIDKHFWLAKTYMALGDYPRALHFMEIKETADARRSRESANQLLGGNARGESIWEFQMLPTAFMRHKSQLEVGRTAEAKQGYDELLAKPKIRENGEIYWRILFDRGRIAAGEGDLPSAIDFYRRAVDIIEQQRSTINTETSKIGFVGDKQDVYRQLVSALIDAGDIAGAFEYVERSKSRALVDLLAGKQDFVIHGNSPEKVEALLAKVELADTAQLIQEGGESKQKTRSSALEARERLRQESPQLASLVSVSSLKAPEIQSLLAPDEMLIEYYANGPDLIAFVATKATLNAVKLDGKALTENVRRFRKAAETPDSPEAAPLSRQLYQQLVAPLSPQLTKAKLTLIAHGPLHYMPFAALHDGQAYLVERFALRLLPSASILPFLRQSPPSTPGDLLAFGNPDLGNPHYDLEFAQKEAITITQGRPQSRTLLRKDANETAFRRYAGNFRYLHFATHGQFNADAPLQSALMLTGDSQSDGRLTVDKLYSMRLNADLVTLSACETGLGKVASGDDVVGLTRGFLYAGASTIVASLWQVDDQSTAFLMMRFYENLKHTDKREALRLAQLETRRKYAHPFYWAAFQLTGAAR